LDLKHPSSLLPDLPQNSRILIIRLRSLGDVVLLTPVLSAIHSWRPDLRLSVLVEPAWKTVLEGNPAVSEILTTDGFLSTALRLRRQHFPVVFNQHGGPTSALWTLATGAAARICWKGKQFGFAYNITVPDAQEYFGTLKVHTVEQRMIPFWCCGLPRGPIPFGEIVVRKEARQAVRSKLLEKGIAQGHYAVVQPGARYPSKRWPPANFVAIAQWLREKCGLQPVISLGPDEASVAGEIASSARGLNPPPVILNSLSLPELIALIADASFYVGNDAGPAHIAAAAATPSVIVFGSSNSTHWRPWQQHYRVVAGDCPCQPTSGERCVNFPEPRCIQSIAVKDVQDACAALLSEVGIC
jgi:heptosyltransferase III